LHKELNESGSPTDVIWWVLEYMPHGVNKGKAVVIDVVIPEPLNYHERRLRLCELSTFRPTEQPFVLPGHILKFPTYRNSMSMQILYGQLRRGYEELFTEETKKQYLWEGIVVQDADQPYELTPKQSMNKHLQTKYRFR
ncbi:MAG: hypothetical protein VW879_06370, partial [Opitutae bacterium]